MTDREKLRATIATAAMQAIIQKGMTAQSIKRTKHEGTMAETVALASVQFADALLNQLEKQSGMNRSDTTETFTTQ